VWVVDTEAHSRDVYLSTDLLMDHFKISLHGSGRWRFAFTDQHARSAVSMVPSGADRAIHKFGPIDELAPGATRMIGLVVPWFSIVPGTPAKDGAMWLSPPGDGEAANITLVSFDHVEPSDDGWAGRDSLGTELIGTLPFDRSGRVDVVYMVRSLSAGEIAMFRSWSRLALAPERDTMRTLLVRGDRQDVRVVFDVAVPFDPMAHFVGQPPPVE
jgi:hypothetical protein